MAKPDQVQDPRIRALIVAAREAYLGDRNLECMEKSGEAFLELLRRQPDFMQSGPFAGNTRRVFPQLGVTLTGAESAAPALVYQRQQFSNPDAITFYEYVTDCLVAANV